MYNTSRGIIKFIILNILTLGIYGVFVMSHISEEINVIASPHDGRHTMHYLLVAFVLSFISLMIVPIVWNHRLCNRIGNELSYRNIDYKFSASDFWLWNILGILIIIGPFVYRHKLFTATNKLNMDYLTNTLGRRN